MAEFTTGAFKDTGIVGELPRHVAMIMDGNGRWAKERGFMRAKGHRAGMERLKGLVRLSSDIGILAVSLYAFSTENWKRPKDEINALCALLIEYFKKEIDELHENKVRILALGDISPFPKSVRNAVQDAMEKTSANDGLRLNIGLNYGSQNELMRAARALAHEVKKGRIVPEDIDNTAIEAHLDTAGLPPVDFLIRTGGEKRLSNFLLYQIAYAELLFLDTYWPDFSDEKYIEALREFSSRKRRYGGL